MAYTNGSYQPIQPNVSPSTPMQTMILVNSEQEASAWSVLPGNSLFFMDSGNKLFYIKSVDFSGMSNFRKFQFEEVLDKPEESRDYITREEFEEWKNSFKAKTSFQPRKGDKIDG